MGDSQLWWNWLVQYPFAAVSILVGGAVVAVVVYTFAHDYARMNRQE